jgi:hypothetical protein
MRHPSVLITIVLGAVAAAAPAFAQPIPPVPLPPAPTPAPDPQPPPDGEPPPPDVAKPPDESPPPSTDQTPPAEATTVSPYDDPTQVAIERAITPDPDAAPPDGMHFPMLFSAPSGRMLPAAVLWSTSGVHTGGGFYGDLFVGLGDVAEFGVGLTDLIRVRPMAGDDPEAVEPFGQASFKMGIAEHRFIRHQPAFALAFRKSFEHTFGAAKLRTAALYFMATKSLGPRVAIHAGGVLWDASIREPMADAYFFHDEGFRNQVRPVLAIEAEPIERSSIMVELNYVPEFTRMPQDIRLSAMLTWGVRYRITSLFAFESGVRVQGIDEANLLDAQIFGQLSWGSDRLRRAIHKLR